VTKAKKVSDILVAEDGKWFNPSEGFVKGKYVIFHDTENPNAKDIRTSVLSPDGYKT